MDRCHILFIDLDSGSCLDEDVTRIQKTIGNAFPLQEMFLETVHIIPSRPLSYSPDLILFRPCSTKFPEEALNRLREKWNGVPIIGLICSKWAALQEISSLLINRLDDFLSCPFREIDLIPRIQRLLRCKIVPSPCGGADSAARTPSWHFEYHQGFVGASEAMREVFSGIKKVAPTDLPVFLLGESGTGKELAALTLHETSRRKKKPMVTVNCAAIPETLLEAELFGYEKGAYTGAYMRNVGKFECADGGTLFLDEIGEMPIGLQAKLLRFLQDKIVERLGARRGKRVDVRVIAATNRDPHSAIAEGRLRSDLYYRLSVVTITLPPLRERGEDKVLLANYLLNKFSREMGMTKTFAKETIEAIRAYDWPGNVREILNRVQRAVVMAEGRAITPKDLDLAAVRGGETDSLAKLREQVEREKVREIFSRCGNNISQAARRLKISRPTFYRLKKKYSL